MKNTQNVSTVRSMTVAPSERKVQNKHDLIQHSAQEKIAMLSNSVNDVIAFSIHYSLGIKRFYNTKRQYILYLVKSRMFM